VFCHLLKETSNWRRSGVLKNLGHAHILR